MFDSIWEIIAKNVCISQNIHIWISCSLILVSSFSQAQIQIKVSKYISQHILCSETCPGRIRVRTSRFHTAQLFSVPWAEDCSWGPGAAHRCPLHPSLRESSSSWIEGDCDWRLEMKPVVTSVKAGQQGNHYLWASCRGKDRKTAKNWWSYVCVSR